MKDLSKRRVVAIGEAMVEMAPAGKGFYRQGFAGDTFNTAWHMSHLLGGEHEVAFLTRIGTDAFSRAFRKELRSDGIDISSIVCDDQRRMGLYAIQTEGSERHFHYWRTDSAARHLADDEKALKAGVDGAGLIHVSGITLAILSDDGRRALLGALAGAREKGALVCFDPNVRPSLWSSPAVNRAAIVDLLPLVDVALPSFDDEASLWGDDTPNSVISRLRSAGVGEVVVKNGAGPIFFFADGECGSLPTPYVDGLVDTTGAGDAFNAGYLAARIGGVGAEGAVTFAQKLSGEVCRHAGARAPRAIVRKIGFALGSTRSSS